METTDFAKHLIAFLTGYLAGGRNYSPNTVLAYRDTFVRFITFMKDRKGTEVKRLTLESITREVVTDFLDFIQEGGRCCNATRNYRLAALKSFFGYMQYKNPERMYEWQKILSIKVKRQEKKSINYLTADGIKLLLEQPDLNSPGGRRNLALLALIYDSGARVQEIIDLTRHR